MGLSSVVVNQHQSLVGGALAVIAALVGRTVFHFCQTNKELLIERTAQVGCEFMAPIGGETGGRNLALAAHNYISGPSATAAVPRSIIRLIIS